MKLMYFFIGVLLAILAFAGINAFATSIAVLTSSESGANSLTDINNNFANLNSGKQEATTTDPFFTAAAFNATSTATSTLTGGIYANRVTSANQIIVGSASNATSTGYVNIAGIGTYMVKQSLISGTTTPCSIQSPNATTTLNRLTSVFNTSTTTSTQWGVSTSTTPFATSSVAFISNATLPANSTNEIVWQPANVWNVIAPNQWIVWWSFTNNTGGGTIITGKCTAIFQTLY